MLMQNFGVTNKEHYGMLWYFLEWSIHVCVLRLLSFSYLICMLEISSHLSRKCSDKIGKDYKHSYNLLMTIKRRKDTSEDPHITWKKLYFLPRKSQRYSQGAHEFSENGKNKAKKNFRRIKINLGHVLTNVCTI